MTGDLRIGLLVGLTFIILFGFVLGQRCLNADKSESQAKAPEAYRPRPAPELVSAPQRSYDDRPVLGRHARRALPPQAVPPRPSAVTPAPTPDRPAPANPARPAAPAPPARTYTVKPGDTLTRIAAKHYGRSNAHKYKRIFLANRDKLASESRLSVGQVLTIPPLTPAGSSTPAPSAVAGRGAQRPAVREMTLEALGRHLQRGRTYKVRAGDCLTSIARRNMGSDSQTAVRRLLEANRGRIRDPDHLPVGLTIRIPM